MMGIYMDALFIILFIYMRTCVNNIIFVFAVFRTKSLCVALFCPEIYNLPQRK